MSHALSESSCETCANVPNLKDRETGLVKRVEGAPRLVRLKLGAKDLHAEQGEDKDKEHEEDEEGVDAGDTVHQRLHQVAHRLPVPTATLSQSTVVDFEFEISQISTSKHFLFFNNLFFSAEK